MKTFRMFMAEATGSGIVSATNSDGHSVHTDGKTVWTKSAHKGAAAPPSLSNFSKNHSVGTEARRKELHAAVVAGHAKGKPGVIAALKAHTHDYHDWK